MAKNKKRGFWRSIFNLKNLATTIIGMVASIITSIVLWLLYGLATFLAISQRTVMVYLVAFMAIIIMIASLWVWGAIFNMVYDFFGMSKK